MYAVRYTRHHRRDNGAGSVRDSLRRAVVVVIDVAGALAYKIDAISAVSSVDPSSEQELGHAFPHAATPDTATTCSYADA